MDASGIYRVATRVADKSEVIERRTFDGKTTTIAEQNDDITGLALDEANV